MDTTFVSHPAHLAKNLAQRVTIDGPASRALCEAAVRLAQLSPARTVVIRFGDNTITTLRAEDHTPGTLREEDHIVGIVGVPDTDTWRTLRRLRRMTA